MYLWGIKSADMSCGYDDDHTLPPQDSEESRIWLGIKDRKHGVTQRVHDQLQYVLHTLVPRPSSPTSPSIGVAKREKVLQYDHHYYLTLSFVTTISNSNW